MLSVAGYPMGFVQKNISSHFSRALHHKMLKGSFGSSSNMQGSSGSTTSSSHMNTHTKAGTMAMAGVGSKDESKAAGEDEDMRVDSTDSDAASISLTELSAAYTRTSTGKHVHTAVPLYILCMKHGHKVPTYISTHKPIGFTIIPLYLTTVPHLVYDRNRL